MNFGLFYFIYHPPRAHLQIRHEPTGQVSKQPPDGELVEDDHRQAEEDHQEVPEGESGDDAVPGGLQVDVVPYDAHEREVTDNPRRKQEESEQRDRVGPVGAVGDRVQRVEEPGPEL